MMSWGFWLVFAVVMCALAEGGMRLEGWRGRRRQRREQTAIRRLLDASRPTFAKPPAIGREAAVARKLGRRA